MRCKLQRFERNELKPLVGLVTRVAMRSLAEASPPPYNSDRLQTSLHFEHVHQLAAGR